MILSDKTLEFLRPIEPFHERTIHRQTGMSYGLSYGGYDVRLAQSLWVWKLLPIRLGSTIERFTMPADCMARVHDKSTNVRKGITVQNTVLEPGWKGYLTLEIYGNSWIPRRLMKGQPIAQIVWERLDAEPSRLYQGKYQNQENRPVPAKREILRYEDNEVIRDALIGIVCVLILMGIVAYWYYTQPL